MTNALLLLLSTIVLVFCFGLQSQLVNNGFLWTAAGNSFLIGSLNIVLFKLVPNANALEAAAYIVGGPIGIVLSMLFFKWRYKSRVAHFYDDFVAVTVKRKANK